MEASSDLAVGTDGQTFKVMQMEKNGTPFHLDKGNHFASQSRSKATFRKLKSFLLRVALKQNKTKRGRRGKERKRITIGCNKVGCYGLETWPWE